MNRTTGSQSRATALDIAQWAHANLTELGLFVERRIREKPGANEECDFLAVGIALCRARQDVRAGIHDLERAAWRASRGR